MDTLTEEVMPEEVSLELGWTVTDENGVVVQSGTISDAKMTAELIEALQLQINQEEVN